MAIRHFFDKSVVIRRLETTSGYKKSYVATATIDIHIQKITDEPTFSQYGVLGATHKAWCDLDATIAEGDKVIDPDNIEYEVVATNDRDFGGQQHKEIILKRYDD